MRKILFIIIILFSTFSFACNCIGKSKIKNAIKNSDAVFVGTVISVEHVKVKLDSTWSDERMEYKFLVTQRFKGKFVNDTIKIYTGFGNGDCGYKFNIGQKYIVYSRYEEYTVWGKVNFLSTDICTRTAFFDERELAKIKRYVKRKDL